MRKVKFALASATIGLVTVFGAGPAAAETIGEGNSNPNSDASDVEPMLAWPEIQASNKSTVHSVETDRGTVKLRTGWYEGTQYGWAYSDNSTGGRYIALDVDLDGDRAWDRTRYGDLRDTMDSPGYPTSSSSDRAFRACIKAAEDQPCDSSYSTPWW